LPPRRNLPPLAAAAQRRGVRHLDGTTSDAAPATALRRGVPGDRGAAAGRARSGETLSLRATPRPRRRGGTSERASPRAVSAGALAGHPARRRVLLDAAA